LVALCIQITFVDPIYHDLLFERFISEYRHDLPDVDMDFDDTRRDDVKRFLEEIYDPACVASITNHGKLKEKIILDDLARIMSIPKQIVATVKGKLVKRSSGDARQGRVLRDSIEMFKELQDIRDTYPRFFEYAEKLEGQTRTLGVHAAGVVVSPRPLTNFLSIEDRKGVKVTSYSGKLVESLGLVKLDILGLKTLSETRMAEGLIGREIDWREIDYENQDVLNLFDVGDTDGIFQFECVDEDMLVDTGDGWESLKDVYLEHVVAGNTTAANATICGVGGGDRELKREAVTRACVHDVGVKECFRLTTEGGDAAIASADHVFFLPDGAEVKLSDLNEGDEVLIGYDT